MSTDIQGACYHNGIPHTAASSGDLQTILTIVISTVGAISVLFIVIGGFRFILSDGDPQAASKARSTIIYALVGLVIAATAEAIVAFVLSNSTLAGI